MSIHCRHGHERSPENTLINARGYPHCRACMRHPRILKTHGRTWTGYRLEHLRALAAAGLSKKRAAELMRVGYETVRTVAEVHQIEFRRDKPGRKVSPVSGFVVAESLSALIRRLQPVAA